MAPRKRKSSIRPKQGNGCLKKQRAILNAVKKKVRDFTRRGKAFVAPWVNFYSDRLSKTLVCLSRFTRFIFLKGGQKLKRMRKIVVSAARGCIAPTKPAEQCAICYEALEDKDKVRKMCHTVFHEACLQTAITNGFRTCPLCRTHIPDAILTQQFRKKVLVHASSCQNKKCDFAECAEMKGLFRHVRQCGFANGCVVCNKMALQLNYHHNECFELFCNVPMCFFPWNR